MPGAYQPRISSRENWRVSRNCASSGGIPIRSYLALPSSNRDVAGAAAALRETFA